MFILTMEKLLENKMKVSYEDFLIQKDVLLLMRMLLIMPIKIKVGRNVKFAT